MSAPGAVIADREREPDQRRVAPRLAVFGIAIVLTVTGLGLRLFQLQLTQAMQPQDTAVAGVMTTRPIPVARGLIYDRKGRLLVENVPTFVMRIVPAELPYEQRPDVSERLATLTDVPARRIIEKLDAHIGSQFEPVRIADVTTETARVISEDQDAFPGVRIELEARRRYLHGELLAHVLGWTGRISGPEYVRLRDDGYWPEDLIGKAGLEASYEDVLRGQYGLEEVEFDRNGNELHKHRIIKEQRDSDLIKLTIDTQVKRYG
jgi:penicillin-binding protein 2